MGIMWARQRSHEECLGPETMGREPRRDTGHGHGCGKAQLGMDTGEDSYRGAGLNTDDWERFGVSGGRESEGIREVLALEGPKSRAGCWVRTVLRGQSGGQAEQNRCSWQWQR